MDLTRQPPRRPSNTGIAGIVNLARMADKARAYNNETQGEYLYGTDSGLDKILLEFLGISADDFSDAVSRYDDETLGRWVLEVSGKTESEIQAFNQHHLQREPSNEAGKKRLRDRVEKYAPGRTDIKTVFQSIELDDWAGFRDVDLTRRAPRSPYCRDVGGIYDAARVADKARADKAGKLGEYIYNCPIDKIVLEFLGISAEDFQAAAYENPNDLEFGAWVLEKCGHTRGAISTFNARLSSRKPVTDDQRKHFEELLAEAAPGRTDIATWLDLLDADDETSFGAVDLSRHAPRSPYDTGAGGLVGMARMIDKGRAALGNTLGEYFYGNDSGADKRVLEFLGVSADAFAGALKECSTDADVVAWLKKNGFNKSDAEIAAFNDAACAMGSQDEKLRARIRDRAKALDPSRADITTFYALMHLDDRIFFARRKAGV